MMFKRIHLSMPNKTFAELKSLISKMDIKVSYSQLIAALIHREHKEKKGEK